MSHEAKTPWIDLCTADKERYRQELKEYHKERAAGDQQWASQQEPKVMRAGGMWVVANNASNSTPAIHQDQLNLPHGREQPSANNPAYYPHHQPHRNFNQGRLSSACDSFPGTYNHGGAQSNEAHTGMRNQHYTPGFQGFAQKGTPGNYPGKSPTPPQPRSYFVGPPPLQVTGPKTTQVLPPPPLFVPIVASQNRVLPAQTLFAPMVGSQIPTMPQQPLLTLASQNQSFQSTHTTAPSCHEISQVEFQQRLVAPTNCCHQLEEKLRRSQNELMILRSSFDKLRLKEGELHEAVRRLKAENTILLMRLEQTSKNEFFNLNHAPF